MGLKQKFNKLSRLTRFFWKFFIILVLLAPIYYWSVKIDLFNLYGGLPSLESLENPNPDLASLLISSDGKTLDKYYQLNRNPVDYDELSPYLVHALVGTEDRRFYTHSGIDLIGLTRAFVSTAILMRAPQGGSTITQQLAKMLWETRSAEYEGVLSQIPYLKLLIIKTKEWIVAVQIEEAYTKKEIISMYFNTMPFGNNTFGIKVAAETYFNKQPIQLQVHEAALLVGVLNGPSFFNPVRHPERAKDRRDWVLRKLFVNGYITEEVYQESLKKGLDLNFRPHDRENDLIAYLKGVLRADLRAWAAQNNFNLYQDGLRIYTTIDSRMQKHAEAAVRSHMKYLQKAFNLEWKGREPWSQDPEYVDRIWKTTAHYRQLARKYGASSDSVAFYARLPRPQKVFSWNGEKDMKMSPLDSIRYYKKFLHTGFMAMDPANGQIKAWVGGIDYNYFKYDHVRQGKNQPGSTFKPFVYTTAIANGYSPCFKIMDAPITYDLPGADPPYWTPQNATDKFNGELVTLKEALRRSMNRITAMMMNKLGPENVVETARRMGIKSQLNPVMSLSLGSSDVSVHEMVGAYATFANQGVWNEPYVIARIEDKYGNILMQNVPQKEEAVSAETAYTMLQMLKGTIYETDGTAYRINDQLKSKVEMAGKTGTTSDYADGWFMGITPRLVAGAWVGGDDRYIRFTSFRYGQGAVMALPIWEQFMQQVYNDSEIKFNKVRFSKPSYSLKTTIDCEQEEEEDIF